jgi:transketolase
MATREAYGVALAKLATSHPRVVALDCDVKNSTFSMNIMKVDPVRFIECFISEQNMVGVGIGVACRYVAKKETRFYFDKDPDAETS